MKVKIVQANSDKIEALLHGVNGKASAHAFTSFYDIRDIADNTECRLDGFGLAKSWRKGARVIVVSGDKLPNAYKYSVNATGVVLLRGVSDWFLIDVQSVSRNPQDARGPHLMLEQEQDTYIVNKVRSNYDVTAR